MAKKIVSVFYPPVSNVDDQKQASWEELCGYLTATPKNISHDKHGAPNPEEKADSGYFIRGIIPMGMKREDPSLEECNVIIFDIDKGKRSKPSKVKKTLTKHKIPHVVYSTATKGNYRIVLLSKPYHKDESEAITKSAYQMCMDLGLKFKYAGESNTRSQPWFEPQTTNGNAHYAEANHNGKPFDGWDRKKGKKGKKKAKGGIDNFNMDGREMRKSGDITTHLEIFVKALESGTQYEVTKVFIGQMMKDTSGNIMKSFNDADYLIRKHLKDKTKKDRWFNGDGTGTRTGLLEWYNKNVVGEYEEEEDVAYEDVVEWGHKDNIEQIDWAWSGRIPRGKVTLLAGTGGVSKTTFAIFLAALISRGNGPSIGENTFQPGKTIIVTNEDGLNDTLTPRMIAAGGKHDHIGLIKPDIFQLDISDQSNLDDFEKICRTTENLQMVVIDPVTTYQGDADSHKAAEVGQLMAKLAILAKELDIIMLPIIHTNKGLHADTIDKISGSKGYTNSVRVAHFIHKDEETEKMYIGNVKNNLARLAKTIEYEINEKKVKGENRSYINLICEHDEPISSFIVTAEDRKKRDTELAKMMRAERLKTAYIKSCKWLLKNGKDDDGSILMGTFRKKVRQFSGFTDKAVSDNEHRALMKDYDLKSVQREKKYWVNLNDILHGLKDES